jgi:serine phosphatase RsbU (regulator of sigma subunit)
MEALSNLFSMIFIPHGQCYAWVQELVWLHAISDILTAIAYFLVAGAIIYFTYNKELPKSTVILLVGTFLVFMACGITHTLNAVTIWYPMYWVSGAFKLSNSLISLYVFIALLIPLIPIALNAPTPAQLEAANDALARANAEILRLNDNLKVENERMGSELEVTRKLQQMVLPSKEELEAIRGLDIAGFMEPASEVGGDYYDVLHHEGRTKIGIGDVTGHGLESGVVMLMVQMAVRTLLASGVTDPKLFLNSLNKAVFDNVQRMDTDKNLTLALLDYHDGKLHLIGQHEEVLLVRKNGALERIDTIELGFMIGLKSDIRHLLKHIEINLDIGDGVVLYTDGITEAHNNQDEMYGIERLCQVVSKMWEKSNSTEVQQAVISDMRSYIGTQQIADDITLVVVKRIT